MAKITFLLGSGASAPFGLPTMIELTLKLEKEFPYISTIRQRLEKLGFVADIEAVLTLLNAISSDGLDTLKKLGPTLTLFKAVFDTDFHISLKDIDVEAIKMKIWDLCNIPENDPNIDKASKYYLALFEAISGVGLIRGANDEKSGLEHFINIHSEEKTVSLDIFTTNYDLLLERMCTQTKIKCSRGLHRTNGAISKEIFNPDLIDDPNSLRLYKLHGSLDFYIVGNEIRRLPAPPATKTEASGSVIREELLIYPMQPKYVYSYPYLNLFRTFYDKLIDSQVCIIIGHSLRDEAINNVLSTAMTKNHSLKLICVGGRFLPEGVLGSVFLNEVDIATRCIGVGLFGDYETIDYIIHALQF